MIDTNNKVVGSVTKLLIICILFTLTRIQSTSSYFSQQITINNNQISTGHWTDSGPPPLTRGDVIINEVMWMGSTSSTADEWIELKNTTDHEIDIGQWIVDNTRHTGSNTDIMIPAGRSIPAHGFFLLSNYPETSANSALNVPVDQVNNSLSLLNLANGNLILKDKGGNIIDQALGDPSWAKGVNSGGIHKSMERNGVPGDGLVVNSWHNCIEEACKSGTFWDSPNTSNFGTPKADNLSQNTSKAETTINSLSADPETTASAIIKNDEVSTTSANLSELKKDDQSSATESASCGFACLIP